MEVDYLLVADAAEAINGKHYIHGGGFDTIMAFNVPATHARLGIAARFLIDWNETNQPFDVKFDILNADGKSILPRPFEGKINVGRPVTAQPGDAQAASLALNLVGLMFPTFGDYAITASVNGIEKRRVPFHVRSISPAFPVPQPQ